jgi:hypothetical protein
MVVHAFICYNHLIMCAYNNSNRSLHVNTGLQLEKTSSKPRSLSDWPKEEVIKSYRAAPHIESFVCLPWWAHYMLILEKIPGILQITKLYSLRNVVVPFFMLRSLALFQQSWKL